MNLEKYLYTFTLATEETLSVTKNKIDKNYFQH